MRVTKLIYSIKEIQNLRSVWSKTCGFSASCRFECFETGPWIPERDVYTAPSITCSEGYSYGEMEKYSGCWRSFSIATRNNHSYGVLSRTYFPDFAYLKKINIHQKKHKWFCVCLIVVLLTLDSQKEMVYELVSMVVSFL